MTTNQIYLVKKTWKVFRSLNHALVGDTFYSKLFTENPSLRRLFPKNMEAQYRKLIDMLSIIVARLEKLDELSEEIAAMARRHVSYGVKPGHYKLVGNALLWTLEKGLGSEWTPEIKDAWTACYNTIAETMIAAAEEKPVR